jgi:ABC-type multidrug transport system ATPase subunit
MSLKIEKLTKTYSNGVKAIDRLDLEIKSGMFGLLGPNGAGKSSLMRTIATLQNPSSGAVSFDEIDVLKKPMDLRKKLGYLPQSFGVSTNVSAEKLLDYFAVLKGISSKKDRNTITQSVLELTNLYDVRKKSVSGYSGGMKQRFGIAQLLLNNPKLIIVDEPTAGLDPAERNRFLNVLREVGSENTVIFSTHIVEDVKELCTDMAIMNGGKILQKTIPSEAIKNINGKIWIANIAKQDLDSFEKKYDVLSSSYNEDNSLAIRVFSNERPTEKFNTTNGNLEDVYFIALKKSNH